MMVVVDNFPGNGFVLAVECREFVELAVYIVGEWGNRGLCPHCVLGMAD